MGTVLIYSSAFHPAVGGVESVSMALAETFSEARLRTIVITRTPSPEPLQYPFVVLRNPSIRETLRAYREADAVLHMNVSLRALWPLAVFQRALIVVHNGFYRREDGRTGIRDRLKHLVARWAVNVACSEAVRKELPASAIVIRNPYQDGLFRVTNTGARSDSVLFVGRLVSEKGVDLLLRSLAALESNGLTLSLTIVGSGPEEHALAQLCRELALGDRIKFMGTVRGSSLAALMNEHKVLVVPSRSEGFGVVAVEGIASGCIVVGSDAGGLPEAIGECGLVFRNGDVEGMAQALARAMEDDALQVRVDSARTAHLAPFSRSYVGLRYLDVVNQAIERFNPG